MKILAADLGGTHARFAVMGGDRPSGLAYTTQRTYDSAGFEAAIDAVRAFVDEQGRDVDVAAIAMAGPVRNGSGSMPNLGWALSEREVADGTGLGKVTVMNDFVALGREGPLSRGLQVERPALGLALQGSRARHHQRARRTARCCGRWVEIARRFPPGTRHGAWERSHERPLSRYPSPILTSPETRRAS